jgi:hypothetical protein
MEKLAQLTVAKPVVAKKDTEDHRKSRKENAGHKDARSPKSPSRRGD